MLTDIFAFRYSGTTLWKSLDQREKRLINQSFRIIKEQIAPYYSDDGKVSEYGKAFWEDIHNRLSTELGVKSLSRLAYAYPWKFNGVETMQSGTYTMETVCENWLDFSPPILSDVDAHIKERLSLVEIALRKKEGEIAQANKKLPEEIEKAKIRAKGPGLHLPGDPEVGLRAWNKKKNDALQAAVDELNIRFRQAGCKLHYHNGFIQISDDELILQELENPFWTLVAGPIWKNVDTDMKEAIDRRDGGERDPAWYAARALESTIKIISGEKGWSHGREKGAHNFIDNLAKKDALFIERWEADALKSIFTELRNPFGHGPGSEEMPRLTPQQIDLAIELCMSWAKSLIKRF